MNFLRVDFDLGGSTQAAQLLGATLTAEFSFVAGSPPSSHAHAISDVTGLQTALDGKSATSHTHSNATTSVSGFMSSSDKQKLDGIAAGAEVNVNADWNATSGDAQILNKPSTFPFTDDNAPCVVNGQQLFFVIGQVNGRNTYKDASQANYIEYNSVDSRWRVGEGGSSYQQSEPTSADYPWLATWPSGLTVQRATSGLLPASHTHHTATTVTDGFLSGPDKSKLDGIAAGAEVNPSFNTGKTIYVDAGVGTDTRTGLSKYDASKPFATIHSAVASSAIGDLVYVRAGSYTSAASIDLGSTVANTRGSIFFETGSVVVVVLGTLFLFSTNDSSVSVTIDGNATFVMAAPNTRLLQKSGASNLSFKCFAVVPSSFTNAAVWTAGPLFSSSQGIVAVTAETIVAPLATCFSITDAGASSPVNSSRLAVWIKTVESCYRFAALTAASTATNGAPAASLTCDFWTIGATDGVVVATGATHASMRGNQMNNYVGSAMRFSYLGAAFPNQASSFGLRGMRIINYANASSIHVTGHGWGFLDHCTLINYASSVLPSSLSSQPCITGSNLVNNPTSLGVTTAYATTAPASGLSTAGGTLHVSAGFAF